MQHPEYTHRSSLKGDGSREKIRIADVSGRYNRAKKWVYPCLIILFVVAPFLSIGHRPLILLDIANRQFFLFGMSLNAQDIYLIFFVVTGVAFSLFFITAVAGRIWCGWGCPQTVFLEGLFRRFERWIDGNRNAQLRLANMPWGGQRVFKFVLKHGLYVSFAAGIALVALCYFVASEGVSEMIQHGPASHPIAFGWFLFLTAIIYFNFAWFREQLCLIICPYGRLQSALSDDDTLLIGYDERRGEPRGKVGEEGRGDCIDCQRCVVVCPTGIDIRKGLQIECIGCANCVDACNEIMDKVNRPRGLVRYDSLNGLEGKPRRVLRPRVYLYAVLLLIGAVVMSSFALQRRNYEANLLRAAGAPFELGEQHIRNQFRIHLFNKQDKPVAFAIKWMAVQGMRVTMPMQEVTLGALRDQYIPLFVDIERAEYRAGLKLEIQVSTAEGGLKKMLSASLAGPRE